MKVELYPHQKAAVAKLRNGKILVGDVGSGKSLTALVYVYSKVLGGVFEYEGDTRPKPTSPKDIYIITTAKKRDEKDWTKEIALLGFSHEPVKDIQDFKVVVDSWHNIKKYREVKNAVFILDEQRLVGNGAWVNSFLEIAKNNHWILLSATPGDNWSDYIPVFLANNYYRNRTEFVRRHIVVNTYGGFPKIERYLETKRLVKLRDSLLVDMPFEKHTIRHEEFISVSYDKDGMDQLMKRRWNIYKNAPIMNASELFASVRRLLGTHPSRIQATRDILKKTPRLIIFYNFDHELERLRTLSEDYVVAEHNGHKHQPVPDTDSWVYLVQYTSGSEAWNCVTTDSILFYSLSYSWRTMEQSRGRIDRMNTPYRDLYYYYFVTESFLEKGIIKALKEKKDFNEAPMRRRYQKLLWGDGD